MRPVRFAALTCAFAAGALMLLAALTQGFAQLPASPIVVVGDADVAPMLSAAAVGLRQRSQGAHLSVRPDADGAAHFCQGEAHILGLPRQLSQAETAACRAAQVTYGAPVRIDLTISAEPGGDAVSRTVFLYVNAQARRHAAVQDFVQHFIRNSQRLALQTGYLSTPARADARAAPLQPPAALTVVLSVEPEVIRQGQTARLRWWTENATSAEIDNGVGAVAARGGTHTVKPQATTTYTLVVSGAGGQRLRREAVVRVEPALAPRGSLAASRQRIEAGERVRLSWSTANAASASIDRGVGAVALPSGWREVAPDTTTTYTLTLTGADGRTVKNQVTVEVGGAPATPQLPPAAPQGALRIEPAVVAAGDEAKLVWAIANAAQAEIDNGVGAVAPRAGSRGVRPRTTTTYTLTVVGADGNQIARAQASVWVRPKQPLGFWPLAGAGLAAALLVMSLVYWRTRKTAPSRSPSWRASRRVPFRNQTRQRVEPAPEPPPQLTPPEPPPIAQTSAVLVGDHSPRISVDEGPGRGLEISYAVTGKPASVSIETESLDGSGRP